MPYYVISIYSNTLLIRFNASSNSSLVITKGGAKRITASWVSLHNKPFSFNASQNGLALSCNSTPMNNPRPRTSLIAG